MSDFDDITDALTETFADYAITATAEELEQQLGDEWFFLNPLAIGGQMTMIYAPPNAGKTLIILHLAREFTCQSITSTPTTTLAE